MVLSSNSELIDDFFNSNNLLSEVRAKERRYGYNEGIAETQKDIVRQMLLKDFDKPIITKITKAIHSKV